MEKNNKKITLYENNNKLLNASIDKITVEVTNKRKQDSVQIIAMSGCSPLAGTTSISISLAIAMAATSRKTVLVDCDLRKNYIYKTLQDQATVGLADYVSNKKDESVSVDDILYSTNIDDLFYIPCGESDQNPTRILCSGRFDELLAALGQEYDCIILDCPSFSVVPDAEIMFSKVDGIIFVAALGETKKTQIKDAHRRIIPYMDKYYGMIINKISKSIFKANVKNADYYITDKAGKQRFEKVRNKKKKKNANVSDQEKTDLKEEKKS